MIQIKTLYENSAENVCQIFVLSVCPQSVIDPIVRQYYMSFLFLFFFTSDERSLQATHHPFFCISENPQTAENIHQLLWKAPNCQYCAASFTSISPLWQTVKRFVSILSTVYSCESLWASLKPSYFSLSGYQTYVSQHQNMRHEGICVAHLSLFLFFNRFSGIQGGKTPRGKHQGKRESGEREEGHKRHVEKVPKNVTTDAPNYMIHLISQPLIWLQTHFLHFSLPHAERLTKTICVWCHRSQNVTL